MALQSPLIPVRLAPTIRRVKGLRGSRLGPGSRIYEALVSRSKEFDYHFEDFLGATVAEAVGTTKFWQYAESNAAAVDAVVLTPTATYGSYIELDTNTTDDVNMNLNGKEMFLARNNPWFESKFQVDTALANNTYELVFGFVDAIPGSAADVLGDIDTPTFSAATDAAVLAADGDQTLKTFAAVTIGTSTAAAKTTIAPTTAPYGLPTLNVDVIYRVDLRGKGTNSDPSVAYFWINDQLMVTSAAGPDDEIMLAPVFQLGVRSTTRVKAKVDYLEVGQQKLGAPFFTS